MTVKSTITLPSTQHEMKRGDLYISNDKLVVLVTAAPMNPRAATTFAGVVLHSGVNWNEYQVGAHDDSWIIKQFKPFYGTLTLETTP